jgi:hypothetical protein
MYSGAIADVVTDCIAILIDIIDDVTTLQAKEVHCLVLLLLGQVLSV